MKANKLEERFSGDHYLYRNSVHEMSTTDCRQSKVPFCIGFSTSSAFPSCMGIEHTPSAPKRLNGRRLTTGEGTRTEHVGGRPEIDHFSPSNIAHCGISTLHFSPGNHSLRGGSFDKGRSPRLPKKGVPNRARERGGSPDRRGRKGGCWVKVY